MTDQFRLRYRTHIYEELNSNTELTQSFFRTTKKQKQLMSITQYRSTNWSTVQSCTPTTNWTFYILDQANLKMSITALPHDNSFANARNGDSTGDASCRFLIKPLTL
jgi:hypothetical protein